MWASILSAFTDSLLKQVFSLLCKELEDRKLIAQGKSQQYIADLQASVTQAKDAAQIREQVAAMPSSDIDDQLERLRHPAPTSSSLR